jgi:hypothetical protein
VQANRMWQHHFAAALVATPENLGVSGALPSHPELLEYLTDELIGSGWSMKTIHRLLLSSAAYRQSSTLEPRAFEVDPDNRLLWRHRLTRLDAEAIRDAMLAVAGRLDYTTAGPYVPTVRDESGEVAVKPGTPGENRRSIYLQQRRTQTLSFLNVFDSPSMVFNCVQRPESTMPLQSLSLLNGEFVVAQARHFARRIAAESPDTPQAHVERAYLLAFGRAPSEAEAAAALDFVSSQRAQYDGSDDADDRAWAGFCQALLASNEFLYLE